MKWYVLIGIATIFIAFVVMVKRLPWESNFLLFVALIGGAGIIFMIRAMQAEYRGET